MNQKKDQSPVPKTFVGVRMPTALANRMKARARRMSVDHQKSVSFSALVIQACEDAYPPRIVKKERPK